MHESRKRCVSAGAWKNKPATGHGRINLKPATGHGRIKVRRKNQTATED
jgi:hypothetical protein